MDQELKQVLKDFSEGPLTSFRKQASFDWKSMKLLLENKEGLLLKYKIWSTLEKDPLFAHPVTRLTKDEYRLLTLKRVKRLIEYNFLPVETFAAKPYLNDSFVTAVGQFDWSVLVKHQLLTLFVVSALIGMGTDRHFLYIEKLVKNEIGGCFCLTEISHGSNTKAMRTTANFDIRTQEFILHTPDFEAAKCWAGNLGETATHAVVFCSLITPDGTNHGLHAFFVQVRDTVTFESLPGVKIGDMGEKLGLNGVDNGVMMFDHFRVPKDTLLNRTGDVDESGAYVSPYSDKRKRLGASLGTLSAGRVGIGNIAACNLAKAIVIGIRYSAVRRQFGPEDSNEEFPVIEYQLQQWRLFTHLASAYVLTNFNNTLRTEFYAMQRDVMKKTNPERTAAVGAEIHAVSSCSKPLASWMASDAVHEVRQACGGHGYLAASGLLQIKEDSDPSSTYEGDNNVLLQQTANWLLVLWSVVQSGRSVAQLTPLGTASYFDSAGSILRSKCAVKTAQQWLNPQALLDAYRFTVCYLLESTSNRLKRLETEAKMDPLTARNQSQAYYYRPLSIAFGECLFLSRMLQLVADSSVPAQLRTVLQRLAVLYGAYNIEKHLYLLIEGGHFHRGTAATLHEAVEQLCAQIKPDAVALVDAIAPPDFVLHSALGHSDGEAYRHLEERMAPGFNKRPDWWRLIVQPAVSRL